MTQGLLKKKFGKSAVVWIVNIFFSFSGIHEFLSGSKMLNEPPGVAKVFCYMLRMGRESTVGPCQSPSIPMERDRLCIWQQCCRPWRPLFLSVYRMRLWSLPGDQNVWGSGHILACKLCQKKRFPPSLTFYLYNCHKQCELCTSITPLMATPADWL